jgi:hypothetical protein
MIDMPNKPPDFVCKDCGKSVKRNQQEHTCKDRNKYWLSWFCEDDIEELELIGCKSCPKIVGRGVARR